MMRNCPKCGESKPLGDFPRRGKHRDQTLRYGYCKPCHAIYQRTLKLRRVFNLTPEDYDAILAHQGGVCALCGKPPGRIRLAVDHDHATGLIRGLVCPSCNRGLAYWHDDAVRLSVALKYLSDPPATRALGDDRFGRAGRAQKRPYGASHYPTVRP